MQKQKITILHIIETTGPGGAETVLLNIVSGLSQERYESIVVLKGSGWLNDSLTASGIVPVVVPSRGALDWRYLRTVSRLVRRHKVDLIHSHLPDSNFYACLAGLMTRTSVIATFHGMVGAWYTKTLKNRAKMAVIRSVAKRVVAVSDFLKREMITEWSFSEDQLTRIYNGVDFAKFDSATGADSVRTEFHIPAAARLVVSVGNIRKPKGYEYLLRAARRVIDEFGSVYFLVAGEGHGVLLEELQALRRQLKLEEHVILAGFREDVATLLKACDLFVLPSVTEGLSIATIEAMGLGKPVVVTDSGGPSEIVESGRTGLLAAPRDAESLAQGILRLLKEPQLATQLGTKAKLEVSEKFSATNCVKGYADLYESCLRDDPSE